LGNVVHLTDHIVVLRIPTLAIHLDRQETFTFNKETQLFPIAGLVAAELNRTGKAPDSKESEGSQTEKGEFSPSRPLRSVTTRIWSN
jgi:Aspartyl aminopeptidase